MIDITLEDVAMKNILFLGILILMDISLINQEDMIMM